MPETDNALLSDIKSRLNNVFKEVFDDEEIEIHDDMNAEDFEEWDSLMHVTLVVAAEKEFGMRFSAADVAKLQNVGEMIQKIARNIEKK
jgi:acyl carrier protein